MSLDSLSPIRRQTVHERVYQELRHSLGSGLFEAGEVLSIRAVAQSLETSTMPVREALTRLVADRALEMLPNRSTRIPLITPERLADIARVRELIEGEATLLAVPRLSETEIAELRELTTRYDAAIVEGVAIDTRRIADLNYHFHQTLYKAAGSETLLPIIDSLWLQSGPFVRAATRVFDDREGPSATHHHWSIIDAIERRDPVAARDALLRDISRTFDLLQDNFADTNKREERRRGAL